MEVSYKKDLRNNYLVIPKDESCSEEAYCVRMLHSNSVPGIIKPDQRIIDNRILYYYDITSLQSLEIIYEKTSMSYLRLKNFFLNLTDTIEQTYEYLLNENDLVLMPKHIYMDLSSEKLYICYLPGYNKDIRNQLADLIEYIMNKVEYQDKEAVLYIYNLYAVCREESFSYNKLLLTIKENKQDNPNKIEIRNSKTKEKQNNKPEPASENHSLNKQIPVMMEKIADDQERYYYPLKTYVYTGLCIMGLIIILIISFNTKIIYTSLGNRIDYSKLTVLLLMLFAVTGYLIKKIWDKKNRLTKIISKSEYIDPRIYDTDLRTSYSAHIMPTQSISTSKSHDLSETNEDINPTVLLNTDIPSLRCYLEPEERDIYEIIQITDFPFVIGKQKGNVDYFLDREAVSRYHVKITKEEDKYYITDLNSTNGTCLNKNPLSCYQRNELKDEDEVAIAGIKYLFREN